MHTHERNPNFIHHQPVTVASTVLREIVFGMEDGMVSTMGAVTGIAAGLHEHFAVVLSGLVIVAVESISMAVGSYLSSKSEKEVDERKLHEELMELRETPDHEREELVEFYKKDGWPDKLAVEMAEAASRDEKLFLQEMAYRELGVMPEALENPVRNGAAMGISYVIGGAIPLLPYLVMSEVLHAIPVSIVATLVGLFSLGSYTASHSKRVWWKAGLEMLILAATAGFVGYGVGQLVERVMGS